MKKFFTHYIVAFSIILFASATLQAQYWEEQFDGGLNGWTIDTIFNDGVDSMSWRWTDTGNPGPVFIAPNPAPNLMSPTASNGAMVFNFEYMRYGADGSNVAQPYGEYVGELISPTIDLSSATGPLNINFYQVGRILNTATSQPFQTQISFSNDDGMTWGAPIDANPNQNIRDVFNGQQTLRINGNNNVQGSSTVKVRFTYSQDFYYWMIDDITITDRTMPDMQANVGWYAIPPNYATPASQVDEFGFMVDIENVGGVAQDNVNVNMRIQNNVTGAVVYEADKAYGSLPVDSLAENEFFGSFTPDPVVGSYTGTYLVSADGMDSNPGNNAIPFEFEVTEDTYSKLGPNSSLGPLRPAGTDFSWSMGNVYYVPNAGYEAESVTFGVANASDLIGQFLTINLLKWEGDLNENDVADSDEYVNVAFNGHTFTGTENNQILSIPVDLEKASVPLEAGGTYIVTMSYTDTNGLPINFLASQDYEYRGMVYRTDSLGVDRYATVLDVGNSGDLTTGNFAGGYYVPPISMTITSPIIPVKEISDDNIVKVFPNPTADELNINLDLVEYAEVLNVKIVDMAGKILLQQQFENIQNTTLEYDLRKYNSGSYMVHLETEEGIKTVPFLIQK